jgi:hypothetical protein
MNQSETERIAHKGASAIGQCVADDHEETTARAHCANRMSLSPLHHPPNPHQLIKRRLRQGNALG